MCALCIDTTLHCILAAIGCYCLRETLIKFIICKVSLPHKLSLFDSLLMLALALFSCIRFCRKKKEQPKKEKPDIDQPQTKSRSTAPPEWCTALTRVILVLPRRSGYVHRQQTKHKAPKISPPHPHQLCCYVSKLFSMDAGASSGAYFSIETRCYSYGEKNCLTPVCACAAEYE